MDMEHEIPKKLGVDATHGDALLGKSLAAARVLGLSVARDLEIVLKS